jgi:translation initiation factor 2 beta subunit (eIF-2beta)/eIF-5
MISEETLQQEQKQEQEQQQEEQQQEEQQQEEQQEEQINYTATELDELNAMFNITEKKKKKKKNTICVIDSGDTIIYASTPLNLQIESVKPQQSDGDIYAYVYMLNRCYELNKASSINTQIIRKTPLEPVMTREGRLSKFINFSAFIQSMLNKAIIEDFHSWEKHLALFIISEMNCEGRISNDKLILKGYHNSSKIKTILSKYINMYVKCSQCRERNATISICKKTSNYQNYCNSCTSLIRLPDIILPAKKKSSCKK